MRIDLLTKEYPPHIYGGAGVHATELVRALRDTGITTYVHAFGDPVAEDHTWGYANMPQLDTANAALQTLGVDLQIADACAGADLVHSHTWYANMAGLLAGKLHGIPHVITAHSLEPMRPWKAEQLGGGYRVSSFIEKTAYEDATAIIAVSAGMREDVLRSYPQIAPEKVAVVHNGIDTKMWQPDTSTTARGFLQGLGIDPDAPIVSFVGRITRQKGLPYLLKAAAQLPPEVQIILCAGSPDTPEIAAEVSELIAQLQADRAGVVWVQDMLPRQEVIAILSHTNVFACPSVYEPLGIVNLEAMACQAPVVATATGGIPEVVQDEQTGLLVPIDQHQDGTGTPINEITFINDFAAAMNNVLANTESDHMGIAGRQRATEHFSWTAIAEQTTQIYASCLGS